MVEFYYLSTYFVPQYSASFKAMYKSDMFSVFMELASHGGNGQ